MSEAFLFEMISMECAQYVRFDKLLGSFGFFFSFSFIYHIYALYRVCGPDFVAVTQLFRLDHKMYTVFLHHAQKRKNSSRVHIPKKYCFFFFFVVF